MSHKTLVNGTAYEITAGKTLINGTGYNIAKGTTMAGGSAYDIRFGKMVTVHLEIHDVPSLEVVVGNDVYGDGCKEELMVPVGTFCAIQNVSTGSMTAEPTRFNVRVYENYKLIVNEPSIRSYTFEIEDYLNCEVFIKYNDESNIGVDIYYTSE